MSDFSTKREFEHCPTCGGDLDIGWECTKCGRDWKDWVLMPPIILPYEAATNAELAAYKRGVENGTMESASPNVVGSLLKRIASEREGLIAANALLELANHRATNELAKTFKLEAKIEALSEALREIIGEELSGESNPNVEDDKSRS